MTERLGGEIRLETEITLLQDLIEEIKGLKRETAGYTYLFRVLPEDTEEFEKDLEERRMDSLQLKFSDHGFAVSERATIVEERDIWILSDLRFSFQIIREKDALIVYGKKKSIPLDYELKYESGIQTITTATTQPDTIGTYPPDDDYPNKELIRERSRSEIYPLGRNAPDLWVKNEGPGNLYILSTTNGMEWGYAESKLAESEVDVFHNVYALALRTDYANTQYRATEYKLVTGAMSIIRAERIHTVETDSAVHFTGAISQNCWETENLTLNTDGNPISNKITIKEVNIQSSANLHYVLWFFSTDGFYNSNIDMDSFVEWVDLDIPTLARRIDTNCDGTLNTQYFLQISALEILLQDEDSTNELHLGLQCISALGKLATDGVQIDIRYSDRL